MAAHGGEIWGIAVHPDLFAFATVSTDGTARIWDLLEVSAACELTAGVVADEQPQFLGEDGRLEACDDAERG
jgi:WD40 repeat protein